MARRRTIGVVLAGITIEMGIVAQTCLRGLLVGRGLTCGTGGGLCCVLGIDSQHENWMGHLAPYSVDHRAERPSANHPERTEHL